jgi:hypothetical protein
MKEKKNKRVDFLGPMLLIIIGVILLLNVTGVLDWSIWWSILRLWPLFLVALGLDLLIGRRSVLGALVAALLVILIFVGALWLSTTGLAAAGLASQDIVQPLGDATQAEVTIDPVMGVLRLRALPESANIVEGKILLAKGEEVIEEFSLQGSSAAYTLKAGEGSWEPFSGFFNEHRVWDLGLSPGATLRLLPGPTFGQQDLNLTGLELSELRTSGALGLAKVILPAEGRYQANISQAMGVIEIGIPRGLGVRLNAGTAMVVRQLPGDFQQQDGNVYLSPGYATAENQVDLDVSLAIGLVTVRYLE